MDSQVERVFVTTSRQNDIFWMRVVAMVGSLPCCTSTLTWKNWSRSLGLDYATSHVARKNIESLGLDKVTCYDTDLLSDLQHLGTFDFIYCQEVLHHTSNAERGFHNLCQLLNPDGYIAIYVYKKKAPAREFVDDFMREKISQLTYDEAFAVSEQITEFGRTLHELDTEIELPQIEILEIPSGTYTVQRLIYHFFMKCFWNPDLSYKENVITNYDWYHPQDATRHTLDEVRGWFKNNSLDIIHECVDHYGITVRGTQSSR